MGLEMEVGCVIVLYNPREQFFSLIEKILPQVEHLVLVINSWPEQTRNSFSKKYRKHKQITILENEKNLGLAKAQNQGMEICKNKQMTHILLMDDDSVPSTNLVFELKNTWREYEDRAGIVSPNVITDSGFSQKFWMKPTGNLFWKRRPFSEEIEIFEDVSTTISSGSFFSLELIEKLGGMREDFFIDYIDVEWSLRVRKHQKKIIATNKAWIQHEIGFRKKKSFFGFSFYPTNHSPHRKYYQFRNRMICLKLYWYSFPAWACIELVNCFVDAFRTLAWEEEKGEKFWNILRGTFAGIFYEN